MRRLIRWGLVTLFGLVSLALSFVGLLLIGLKMNQHGVFPCQPLERWTTTAPVANGGWIELAAVEERGPISSHGFRITASYWAPQAATSEPIDRWYGNGTHDPKIYLAGAQVVVLSPDQENVYVRTGAGDWQTYSMKFPSELGLSHDSISSYAERAGISADDLRKVHASLDEESRRYAPSVSVTGFNPQTRVLNLIYFARFRYDLTLRLADDGMSLQMIDIRRAGDGSPH